MGQLRAQQGRERPKRGSEKLRKVIVKAIAPSQAIRTFSAPVVQDALDGIYHHSTQVVVSDRGEASFGRATGEKFCKHPLEVGKKPFILFRHERRSTSFKERVEVDLMACVAQ